MLDGFESVQIDLSQCWDLGIPLRGGAGNPNAFGMEEPLFEVFRAGGFVGDVEQGGACNVVGVRMNPHGNGTHTECAGHIGASPTDDRAMNCGPGRCLTLDQALTTFWFKALLLSVEPRLTNAAMPGQAFRPRPRPAAGLRISSRRSYFFQDGSRFSMKAFMPSRPSGCAKSEEMTFLARA